MKNEETKKTNERTIEQMNKRTKTENKKKK